MTAYKRCLSECRHDIESGFVAKVLALNDRRAIACTFLMAKSQLARTLPGWPSPNTKAAVVPAVKSAAAKLVPSRNDGFERPWPSLFRTAGRAGRVRGSGRGATRTTPVATPPLRGTCPSAEATRMAGSHPIATQAGPRVAHAGALSVAPCHTTWPRGGTLRPASPRAVSCRGRGCST